MKHFIKSDLPKKKKRRSGIKLVMGKVKVDRRTSAHKELCATVAHEGISEIIGFKRNEVIQSVATFSNIDDSFIDSGAPHRCNLLKRLFERGITEQIQARQKPAKGEIGVAQIGFNPKQKKWYGWSHRAIGGFGIGDKFWEEDYLNEKKKKKVKTKICKTLADCKKAASAFAESVS